MRENQLQAQVVRYLRRIPNLWYAVINDRHTSGIPDIIVCYKGHFLAIELKVGSNKPTALQRAQLQRIEQAGGDAIVAYSLAEVKDLINSFSH